MSAVHTQQPDAGPGAPGPEVAQVGLVSGARAVTVAEEELSDQALVGLPIHQDVRGRGWQVWLLGGGDRLERVAIPVGGSSGRDAIPLLTSFRLAYNRHYGIYEQDGGEVQSGGADRW